MSKHARDHAHCGDQAVQNRGHPNQSARGPFHAPPDRTGFTRTNSTVFNPKILEASIKEIASCLTDGAKADLLLYAAKMLDIGRERWALFLCIRAAAAVAPRFCAITPRCLSFTATVSRIFFMYAFEPGSHEGSRFHGLVRFKCRSLAVRYSWFHRQCYSA